MSLLHYIEQYDAVHGIPRPMDAPHLTAYHAALRCLTTGAGMQFLTEIDAGGVGAMEMISRDLKALGSTRLHRSASAGARDPVSTSSIESKFTI